MRRIALALPFAFAASAALAQTPPAPPTPPAAPESRLPAPVSEMIRAAAPEQLNTIAAIARKTQPDAIAEIDAIVANVRAAHEAEKRKQQALATRGITNGWDGSAALGATFTTGNTDQRGLAGKIDLVKQGLSWRHKLYAEADFQESDGERTRERYSASYQADHRFSPRFYTYGFVGWENDRFAGFTRRFTESAGIGWIAVERPRLRLSVEGGPALRQTRFVYDPTDPTGDLSRNELSVRGNTNLRWTIVGDLVFTEEAGFVAGSGNDTLFSSSALTTKLIGNLSTRLSFDVKHETAPPDDRVKTDTVSRASLVYSF